MLPRATINHFGYIVYDIAAAAGHWAETFGAGPFFLLENITFDTISHRGGDARFVHSAAFGWCGSTVIELVELRDCAPAAVAERLIPAARPVLNHIGYVTDDAEHESARLSAMGLEMFLHVTVGDVDARFHDARHVIGCAIELHRKSAYVADYFAQVESAGRDWDGRDLLRVAA